jgi:hypothetical protein
MNHFNITELSTGADLEILRNRAHNQDLWRKGVDAIMEEYKRKWTERENKSSNSNTIIIIIVIVILILLG